MRLLPIATLVVLLGCESGGINASDDSLAMCRGATNATAATPSPDGEGWCCQPGFPTCSCGYFGGFVAERCDCDEYGSFGGPFGLCDLHPYNWVLGTDTHGCARYSARSGPSDYCCNCPRDLGAPFDAGADDASLGDAAADDAAVDDAAAVVDDAAVDAP